MPRDRTIEQMGAVIAWHMLRGETMDEAIEALKASYPRQDQALFYEARDMAEQIYSATEEFRRQGQDVPLLEAFGEQQPEGSTVGVRFLVTFSAPDQEDIYRTVAVNASLYETKEQVLARVQAVAQRLAERNYDMFVDLDPETGEFSPTLLNVIPHPLPGSIGSR